MNDDLKKLEEEAMSSIEQADTEHNLNELKALYLGKKSKLQYQINWYKQDVGRKLINKFVEFFGFPLSEKPNNLAKNAEQMAKTQIFSGI